MPTPASVRALLRGAIDYAGLFPPASLKLATALANYRTYTAGEDAWMLGAFVLPAARFPDAVNPAQRLAISVLGGKPSNRADFADSLCVMASAIEQHSAHFELRQFELALPPDFDDEVIELAPSLLGAHLGGSAIAFLEAVPAGAPRAIKAIARHNQQEPKRLLGFKLRTGGVSADAFPSCETVAAVLVAAARADVPIKFTAGLHHPVRHFHAEVETKMHGFLNVLAAAVFARELGWDVAQTAAMLAEEDPASFRFDNAGLNWRAASVSTASIASHRTRVVSLGSCSFDEPRGDLRALGLMENT